MPGDVPPVADEREGLMACLANQREAVRNAAHGLTDKQARLAPTVSSLTVGGLIKHLRYVEHGWITLVETGERDPAQTMEAFADSHVLRPDETLKGALDAYAQAAERTERVIAAIPDLGRPVPIPRDVPWYPAEYDAWSVRWVLLRLIRETARHAGHADIIREAVDGATALPLMAAVEGWAETSWVKPWTPGP